MPRPRRPAIAEALRQRLQRGLASGALRAGDRLPSTREMAADLDADPRVVADAYRVLAADGLVELRPRAGVFVGAGAAPAAAAAPSSAWLADVIAEGVRHGVRAPALADALAQATRARPLSAAVVAGTVDQSVGIARELRDDFGVDAHPFVLDQLATSEPMPRVLTHADLLVATEYTAERVQRLGERLGVPALIIDVRPDLLSPEWRLLLREAQRDTLYVIIADPRFGTLVHSFLHGAEGAENVRVLVAGQDDVGAVPPGTAAYVTEAARERLGRGWLPERLVAPARTLSDGSLRAVAEALVAWNLAPPPRRARGAAVAGGAAEPRADRASGTEPGDEAAASGPA